MSVALLKDRGLGRRRRSKSKVKRERDELTLLPRRESSSSLAEMTRGNHFEFGYDGIPFVFRTSPEQRWWVNYGRCKRPTLDFRTECVMAAREIAESAGKDVFVCLSGGIDSQVVAEAFRFAKVRFRAAILRFKDDLNLHDIAWAVIYCESHGIPYSFVNVDIREFFYGGEMEEIAGEARCVSPLLPAQMKVMEEVARLGGYPVLGSAECYLRRERNQWLMYEREKIASLYRFLMIRNIRGQAGFFQWNPEIMYSFLSDRLIQKLVRDELPGYQSTWTLKEVVYRNYFELQKRTKYTGFEKIMYLDSEFRPRLESKFRDSDGIVRIPYYELMKSMDLVWS